MLKLLKARIGRRVLRVVGARDDERGMALATVIILGTVLMLMSATIVSISASGAVKSVSDANWVAAGQAAYAGVEDYQSKLANDNSYSQYGNLGTSFSTGSSFTGTNGNPAFGYGTSGTNNTWATVDPSVTTGGTYRYAVDNSKYSASGILRLQSTGRVGNVTRTVVADLKQSGFLDFVYFTDYEMFEPASGSACQVQYAWAATRSSACTTIQFASGDVVNGPTHSNDTITICGATFQGAITTSNPNTPKYITPNSSCAAPTFAVGNGVTYSPVIQMPATIGSLIQETRSDLKTSTVPRPGCLYTGPTTITFTSNGKMTVYSPWTKAVNTTGNPSSGAADNSACGTPGYSAAGNTLGSPGGQTMDVLDSNLIYVQNVPTTSTIDPNYWGTKTPSNYSCVGADGKTVGNGVGYPAVNETPPASTSYGCKNGDAFVQGTFKGNMTIAANNYMYVAGNVVYNDPTQDMLGLIGENNVIVYNPIGTYSTTTACPTKANPSKTCTTNYTNALLDESPSDITIDAAIMSVAHSFTVQNYAADSGNPKGNLNVLGAIAQKFRGAVGQSTTSQGVTSRAGYTKNYQYDPRMAYQAPPKFLSPVSTSYGITQVVETKAAVSATGASL